MNSSTEQNSESASCEYKDNLSILRNIPHFARMPLEPLKVLAYLCARVKFKEGDHVFRQGETGEEAYFILEGVAELNRETEKEGLVKLGEMGPENFIGGLSLLADVKRLFTLTAKTPLTCLTISRKKFWPYIGGESDNSQACNVFLESITQSVVNWEEHYLLEDVCADRRTISEVGVSLV